MVTGDTWYSSRENLKFLKDKELGFLMGIAKNRKVSITGGEFTQVQNLEIPEEGLVVHLKKFGQVKVFRKTFKNEVTRYYIMYLPNPDATFAITRVEFKEFHSIHWAIECYHRAIKQLCGIERFMVRATEAIHTHFAYGELAKKEGRVKYTEFSGCQCVSPKSNKMVSKSSINFKFE